MEPVLTSLMRRMTLTLAVLALVGFGACAAIANGITPPVYPQDTAPDAPLIHYRLEPNNLDLAVIKEFHGEQPALKLALDNGASAPVAPWLSLGAERLYPFSPVIPPYVGLGARKFTAKLWITSSEGVTNMRFSFYRRFTSPLTLTLSADQLKTDQWNTIEFSDAELGSLEHPLTTLRLEMDAAPGAKGAFYLAEPVLTTRDGVAYSLITTAMPLMTAGMIHPLAKGPARALPQRDSLTMGGYVLDTPEWAAGIPAMAKYMKVRFPEVDFVIAPVSEPYPIIAKLLPQLPPGVFFQLQKAQLDSRYLAAVGVLPTDSRGAFLNEYGNSVLATNAVQQKGLKDEIDYSASLGINNWKQVDYVWPYDGGRWGYDKASIAAYRQDLQGQDEGLKLLPGAAGARAGTIHFWDYYEQNHGLRLTPKDIGIANWAQYQPALERDAVPGNIHARKGIGIYVALFHYEWLRQTQRFGRWAKAHGGSHDYTLNPEDVGNGGDYIYLTRMADAGVPYIEYFGGPSVLDGAYINLPMYVHTSQVSGKRLGVITEIGEGGHGENYLDPEVAYLYTYEIGAAGMRNYHNEWMEAPWPTMSDPKNAYLYDRFSSWMSEAYGFRRARREGTHHPATQVVSVSVRSSVHYINSWPAGTFQMESLATPLTDAHVDFVQTDPISLPDSLKTTRFLFYTPPASPGGIGSTLQSWLNQGGKTLVTHSYIPVSLDDGQAQLDNGVQDVVYKGEGHNYSEYIKPQMSASFALLPLFRGLTHDSKTHYSLSAAVAAKAEVLLRSGGQPLLSRIRLPHGSSILYLHERPQDISAPQRNALINTLIVTLHLPRIAIEDLRLGDAVMAHRFQHGQTQVLTLWNRARLNTLGFFGGYGPHLLPGRGSAQFDPKLRPYPYLAPGALCGARIPVQAAGDYRIYRFMEDKEETVHVGADKLLPLTVKDAIVEQFYFALDGDAIRKEVQSLRRHRAEVLPFLLDLPQETPAK